MAAIMLLVGTAVALSASAIHPTETAPAATGWIPRLTVGIAALALGLTIVTAGLLARDRRLSRKLAAVTARSARADARHNEQFRRSVETSPNAVLMIDGTGSIRLANPDAEVMFGYAGGELVGQAVGTLLPSRSRPGHPDLVARFLAAPVRRQMGARQELFGLRKDGREFRLEIALNPIDTDDGPMVLATIVDMSQRMELEAQLRQAQKMEAVGRLTAGIAHDFNNLLQVIMGSLERLQDRISDDPLSDELVTQSINAAQRGSRLTHSLLAFSRTQVLRPARIEIAALMRETVTMLERTLGPAIVIDAAHDGGELHVFADPGQLEACILNLAINARDAMPDGGNLIIRAYGEQLSPSRATETLPAGDYVVIAVEDSGCGIDPAILDKVFEPFFTTKDVGKGSGLGLSMVLGYARQSEGDVHVITTPLVGTRIEIFLPRVGAGETEARREAGAAPSGVTAGRILLVDDATDVLLTLGSFLDGSGFIVTKAASAADALRIVSGPLPLDAVVTDLAMPGMSGADLLAQIAEIRPGLPGLVVTGFPLSEGAGKLPDSTSVLRKPFRRAELVKQVSLMLARSRSQPRNVAVQRAGD